MPSALHKQLIRLVFATACARHITDIKAEQFHAQVDEVLDVLFPFGDMGHLDGMASAALPIVISSCMLAYRRRCRRALDMERVGDDGGDDVEHGQLPQLPAVFGPVRNTTTYAVDFGSDIPEHDVALWCD